MKIGGNIGDDGEGKDEYRSMAEGRTTDEGLDTESGHDMHCNRLYFSILV